jgi:N-acetylneuraminic acid mutarotase
MGGIEASGAANRSGWRHVALAALLVGCGGEAGTSESVGETETGAETTPSSESATASASDGPTGSAETTDGDETGNGSEPSGPHGHWETRASLSEPRQETGVAALGGEVYVVGGFTPSGLTPRVEVYDPVSDAWRVVADFPDAEVHHANVAATGGRLFVAGYLRGGAFAAIGGTFAYDPADDAWTERAQMPVGTERGGSGVAVVQETIYVFGGLQGLVSVDAAWAYDTAQDVWTPIASLPERRDHLVGAAVDGKVYAIGGRTDGIEAHGPHVDVYDPETDTWSPGPPLPTSRGGMGAAVVAHWIFVVGGEGNVDDPTGVYAQLEVLDTMTGSWSSLPPMPSPRHGMGAAAIDGVVYVPGGADVQAFGAVSTHEAWVLGG